MDLIDAVVFAIVFISIGVVGWAVADMLGFFGLIFGVIIGVSSGAGAVMISRLIKGELV